MPRIDMDKIPDNDTREPLPDGTYRVELTKIEEKTTKNGDEMWNLDFTVRDKKFSGRHIFDNLVFSDAAMKRVKLVCSRLGLNVKGEVDLVPSMLLHREALVSVIIEDREIVDDTGKTKRIHRNSVPFDGYLPIDGGTQSSRVEKTEKETKIENMSAGDDTAEDSLPF